MQDIELWHRIESQTFVPPLRACVSSRAEILRWTDWTEGHAGKVAREYRRYLYLTALGPRPIPGPDIAVLRQFISRRRRFALERKGRDCRWARRPRRRWKKMEAGYRRRFQAFRDMYRREFGEDPPAAVWPTPQGLTRNLVADRLALAAYLSWIPAMGLGALGSAAGGILFVTSVGLLTILGFRRLGRYEPMFIG